MAKLKMRSAKGTGGKKSQAKAARRKGGRGTKGNSGQSRGSRNSDASFDFGRNAF